MKQVQRAVEKAIEDKLFLYRRTRYWLRETAQPVPGLSRRKAQQRPNPEELEELGRWVEAIDKARRYLKRTDPPLERFMVRYFALVTPLNRSMGKCARHMRLMEELHMSNTTLYAWRRKAVGCVLFHAAAAGLISPPEEDSP